MYCAMQQLNGCKALNILLMTLKIHVNLHCYTISTSWSDDGISHILWDRVVFSFNTMKLSNWNMKWMNDMVISLCAMLIDKFN